MQTTPNVSPLLTIENLRRFEGNAVTRSLRTALAAARAHARETRAKVDTYAVPMFVALELVDDEGRLLTSPQSLYLALDNPAQEAKIQGYFAALDVAHREHGFDVPAGYCPALVAETAVGKAERALLEFAAAQVGIDATQAHGKLRAEALRLLEGGVQKAGR